MGRKVDENGSTAWNGVSKPCLQARMPTKDDTVIVENGAEDNPYKADSCRLLAP
jgi:hypothetical protein